MSYLLVKGGAPLCGEVRVHGAKNSVLPILAASVLAADVCAISNCPHLRDVDVAVRILKHLGCTASFSGDTLTVDSRTMHRCDVPDDLMREMRSSVIFLGAILARMGEVQMSYPGGCELGPRPIDLHIGALKTLGAEFEECGGTLRCAAKRLCAGEIFLATPSVGATENSMIAACACAGETVISNAAREPEIVDLANFLCAMGADVRGAGTSTVTVHGGSPLHGCTHRVIADRIVAATYLCAAGAAGGEVRLSGIDYRTVSTVAAALKEAGCRIESAGDSVTLARSGALHAIRPVRTAPYPGFPTDAQAILMASLLKSKGTSVFVENIFENRYRHVDELARMGADIRTAGRVAVVCGVKELRAAPVRCTDLRGGAALVIAALTAEGESRIGNIEHIDRGYDNIAQDMRCLGGSVQCVET